MADLETLQSRMALGLLTGRFDAVTAAVLDGPITAQEALGLHRNTALHGLINALRLTYPTVDALVGEAFFDQAALAYIEDRPPSGAWLTGYGADFAQFLTAYALAGELPYLPDVARFDLAVDAVAGMAVGQDGATLDLGEAVLTLDASLTLLALDYPADAIRDALDEDEDALARIHMQPQPYALALWRRPDGAGLRRLSPLSMRFLTALQEGGELDAVLGAGGDPAVLQTEVFAAPFARITAQSHPKD